MPDRPPDYVYVPEAPKMPGLVFRRVRDEIDFAKITDVVNASWEGDLVDAHTMRDEIAEGFWRSQNFDPENDAMLAEVDGRVVGYANVSWQLKPGKVIVYFQIAHLIPEWRGRGLREAMLAHNERRILELSYSHPSKPRKLIETYANVRDNDWKALIERSGYTPGWYLYGMARPLEKELPDHPLPDSVEARQVDRGDLWKIWRAAREAFRDAREFSEDKWSKKAFERRNASRQLQPELWQIAWQGSDVVGGVHVWIDDDENAALGRVWGHTEQVFVARKWRGKSVAKALISRALAELKRKGMECATLDVDSENLSGALRLYEGLGYSKYSEFVFYRKPLS